MSGKNSTLVRCDPNEIPKATNDKISKANVPKLNMYGFLPDKAQRNCFSYQRSNLTNVLF